jgi:multisubunit Na+/H+ antiporter MnhF subunit
LAGIADAGVLSLTAVALGAGHLLDGPAFGDRIALAMTSTKRQMWIAMFIAAINVQGAATIDVIVIYRIITNLVTISYTMWCKKQLVTQAKP